MTRSPQRRSAGILLISDDRVLLLRRGPDANNAGLWGIPGGRLEPGELPMEAAWREACEELGWLPPSNPIARVQLTRGDKRYDIFVCDAGARAQRRFTPRLNHEHDKYKWARLSWAKGRALHPVVEMLLRSDEVRAQLRRLFRGRRAFRDKASERVKAQGKQGQLRLRPVA